VEIDFAPPLDYVEPAPPSPKLEKRTSSTIIAEQGESQFRAFRGNYQRLDGKEVKYDPVEHVTDTEYDPRSRRLKRGVRGVEIFDEFAGSGVRIG